MSRSSVQLLVSSVLALCAACNDDLPKATEIERMRILGAKLSVNGDETRTTPKPGETVHVSLPTVFPTLKSDPATIHSLFISCTAPDRYTGGIPICQELIDAAGAEGASTGGAGQLADMFSQGFECGNLAIPELPPIGALSLRCQSGEPSFNLTIPEGYAADQLLFIGVVCEHSAAVLDPELPSLFGCADDDGEAIQVHGLITVQHSASDENHNPDMDAFHLQRQSIYGAWEPVDPAILTEETEQDCERLVADAPDDPTLPWVIGALPLRLSYESAAREAQDGEPEQLEFTVYATDGDLERRFTLFEPDELGDPLLGEDGQPLLGDDGEKLRELNAELRWDSPEVGDIDPETGELVRFFVTLRDGRGGFGQADYALCALKQEPK